MSEKIAKNSKQIVFGIPDENAFVEFIYFYG